MLKNIILDYMTDKNLKYSIYIKDLKNNQVLNINGDKAVSSASIIKLFIMGKVFDDISKGKLTLDYRLSIDKSDSVPYSIIYVLDKNNTYTVKDLITLMIIQSDNTATNVLIEMLGMERINKYIVDLGFSKTILNRKMMDLDARAAGRDNYTSAKEVATLLELMYNGLLVNKTFSDMMLDILKLQLDSSLMKRDLEEEVLIAHKTGNLPNIKHDAGIVYTEAKDYIFTMFTWDAASDNYARQIIGKVSKLTYEHFML